MKKFIKTENSRRNYFAVILGEKYLVMVSAHQKIFFRLFCDASSKKKNNHLTQITGFRNTSRHPNRQVLRIITPVEKSVLCAKKMEIIRKNIKVNFNFLPKKIDKKPPVRRA